MSLTGDNNIHLMAAAGAASSSLSRCLVLELEESDEFYSSNSIDKIDFLKAAMLIKTKKKSKFKRGRSETKSPTQRSLRSKDSMAMMSYHLELNLMNEQNKDQCPGIQVKKSNSNIIENRVIPKEFAQLKQSDKVLQKIMNLKLKEKFTKQLELICGKQRTNFANNTDCYGNVCLEKKSYSNEFSILKRQQGTTTLTTSSIDTEQISGLVESSFQNSYTTCLTCLDCQSHFCLQCNESSLSQEARNTINYESWLYDSNLLSSTPMINSELIEEALQMSKKERKMKRYEISVHSSKKKLRARRLRNQIGNMKNRKLPRTSSQDDIDMELEEHYENAKANLGHHSLLPENVNKHFNAFGDFVVWYV